MPAESSVSATKKARSAPREATTEVQNYYNEAGPDYAAWSRQLHMHFGYFRKGLRPWRLEPMLDEMTRQVVHRLELETTKGSRSAGAPLRVLDMGCGLGASARLAVTENPQLTVDGITVVPGQVQQARELTAAAGLGDRAFIHRQDYTATTFPADTFDGAYAIESACHGKGLDKADFLDEAARVLKPGARLVVADGFFRGGPPRSLFLSWVARKVASNWAVETFADIGAFTEAMKLAGFRDLQVEDISWRIAPSVAHVPRVTSVFLFQRLMQERLRLSRVRWGHLLACVLSPVLGMARHRFGYFLISATKGSEGSPPG